MVVLCHWLATSASRAKAKQQTGTQIVAVVLEGSSFSGEIFADTDKRPEPDAYRYEYQHDYADSEHPPRLDLTGVHFTGPILSAL